MGTHVECGVAIWWCAPRPITSWGWTSVCTRTYWYRTRDKTPIITLCLGVSEGHWRSSMQDTLGSGAASPFDHFRTRVTRTTYYLKYSEGDPISCRGNTYARRGSCQRSGALFMKYLWRDGNMCSNPCVALDEGSRRSSRGTANSGQ